MIPLSVENESVGSPAMFHALISTEFPSTEHNWKFSEHTKSLLITSRTHCFISVLRKSIVYGPKYAMTPELINIFPKKKCLSRIFVYE